MAEITKISIYGKGGVGKSTITTNLAVCLAETGQRPMLVGCSPKADTTALLLGHSRIPTVLNNIQQRGSSKEVVQDSVLVGYRGVACVESGGPPPASGCAGRGVYHTLNLLNKYHIYQENEITFAIFDAIADVVCGGFSLPMRNDFASTVYIVTTAEMMSLYAANNICNAAVAVNGGRNYQANIGGVISSGRGIPGETAIVAEFADKLGLPLIASIPRSDLVQKAEARHGTVMAHFAESNLAQNFRDLADRVSCPAGLTPKPLSPEKSLDFITELISKHQSGNKAQMIFPSIPQPASQASTKTEIPLRSIAIYGKAGIGKSTTSSNLSAALASSGRRVLQVGCDPKRDSVAQLTHCLVPTILDEIGKKTQVGGKVEDLPLEKVFFEGFNGVVCAEAGGPPPGMGCAGQGVLVALEFITERQVVSAYGIDFWLFDILGDVVCGGFTQPIRAGYCREIYVVTNGEPLSLVITNNILRAVEKLNQDGVEVGVGGLINNQRGVTSEQEIVVSYAKAVGVPVIATIPRSNLIQTAEARRQTVVEAFPQSEIASLYRKLGQDILANQDIHVPHAFQDHQEIFDLFSDHTRTEF